MALFLAGNDRWKAVRIVLAILQIGAPEGGNPF